jgi:hypothetical protein
VKHEPGPHCNQLVAYEKKKTQEAHPVTFDVQILRSKGNKMEADHAMKFM